MRVLLLLATCFFISIPIGDAQVLDRNHIFIVGQDTQSINEFLSSLKNFPGIQDSHYPDGFMVYTAINDLRGLSDQVDQGAGVNFTDELIRAYPQYRVIQIGLFMRYMLKEVVSGGLDQNISQLGQWIINSQKDVYLRIGYEFDNPENEYDPQEYIQAYRYIVDHLKAMNIPNVHFVWHSIGWKDKDWPDYEPLKWYPGDQYVDWVAISFFDSERDVERDIAAALSRKLNKPLMIAESSPFKQYTVEGKLHWIKKLFSYIKNNDVRFLSYINVNWDDLPLFQTQHWGDARLQNNPVLLGEFLHNIAQYRLIVPEVQ
ncbi:MAG: hypothetical protein HQL20_09190 [Candidatus Omnitrophica bacterium]|nr:hypothetical protein [Candidatus Omnitrophota bacterium]